MHALKNSIQNQVDGYRAAYRKYYEEWASGDSPKLRDSNPSVVIVPGLGLFGFGKNKKEARITTEFFINADPRDGGRECARRGWRLAPVPQARHRSNPSNSPNSITTWLSPDRKHSASNIGRSKKQSFSACPPKQNSAARLPWSSAEPAGSAAKSPCCLRRKALIWLSRLRRAGCETKSPSKPGIRVSRICVARSHGPQFLGKSLRSDETHSLEIWRHGYHREYGRRSIPCPARMENCPRHNGQDLSRKRNRQLPAGASKRIGCSKIRPCQARWF